MRVTLASVPAVLQIVNLGADTSLRTDSGTWGAAQSSVARLSGQLMSIGMWFRDHDVELFDLWTQRPRNTWEPIAGVTIASYSVEQTVVIVGLAGKVGRVMLAPRRDWRGLRSDLRSPQVTGNDWLDGVFTVEARDPVHAAVLNDQGFAYVASQRPYPSTIELTEDHLVCAHWVLPIDEQAA